MVFFRVTENINVKIADGTLIKFLKLKKPSELINDNIYCSVYDDIELIKKIFLKVGSKYQLKTIEEKKIRENIAFPRELGVSNINELFNRRRYDGEHIGFFLNNGFEDINKQAQSSKKDISIAVIGGVGRSIGEAVCASTALRIMHSILIKRFRSVKIDIYLISSDNQFYGRDKSILEDQPYINGVFPLATSVSKLCRYDFFIDNGSLQKKEFYMQLPYVDAYLYKFGIDYKKISPHEKHNQIELGSYRPSSDLIKNIQEVKKRGKVLLFHPFAADASRSIPKDLVNDMARKLVGKAKEYIVVNLLELENSKQTGMISLAKYSKSYKDFVYLISNMDRIITVDTATYHIADAFCIPTTVIFSDIDPLKRIKYYSQTKAVKIKDESKNFSNFDFDDALTLNRFEGWKKLKVSKLLK